MDISSFSSALGMIVGVMAIIGFAGLIDFGFRNMAESRAQKAELARFRKWRLPAPVRPEEPVRDEHLWHF
jgi:hypothetical protein